MRHAAVVGRIVAINMIAIFAHASRAWATCLWRSVPGDDLVAVGCEADQGFPVPTAVHYYGSVGQAASTPDPYLSESMLVAIGGASTHGRLAAGHLSSVPYVESACGG